MNPYMSDNLGLDLLPAEVTHLVASFLPFSSILALCFVNRRLYTACYDSAVFKRSAIDALHEDRYTSLVELQKCDCQGCAWRQIEALDQESLSSETTTEVASDEEWYPEPEEELQQEEEWDCDDWRPSIIQHRARPSREWLMSWPSSDVFNHLPASDSARIACAVERAQKLFNVSLAHQLRDLSQRWTRGRCVEWLPHLITLRHVSSLELKPWTLQRLLFAPDVSWWNGDQATKNPCTSEYIAAAFCMLTLTLMWMEAKPSILKDSPVEQDNIREQFCLPGPNDYCVWERMDWLLSEASDIRDFDPYDRYTVILRLIFRIWYYHRSHHTPFPSIHLLPFATFLGSPIPFRTPDDFLIRHCIPRAQLVAYLSGEWLGWCRSFDRSDDPGIQLRLQGIQFAVSEPHPPYAADIVALISSASGKDRCGPFTLEGTVSIDGEVWLRQRYAEDFYPHPTEIWRYRGFLTPFGIAGPHEQDSSPRFPRGRSAQSRDGFFWIWKKDWTHDWPSDLLKE
ncbi:hypothetical protein PMIN02_005107 [Paraphaeosphaeria minitans]|uniref:F-box domain-containing protein n=1 Tax=Paraphaeosphaeria minitans TaxID=565426 RepID=A0A9P6G608_9PLEO|nr:hypothetical protein PMIN01_12371 [Paraphaeosphaeria minitans]